MNDLAIDTAGAGCSAALRVAGRSGDVKITSKFADIHRGHAETIIGQVEALVDEAGVDYHSLNRIICTIGPGSFTGVRIGIAFAKGLALATDLPLFGLSSTLVAGVKIARMHFVSHPGESKQPGEQPCDQSHEIPMPSLVADGPGVADKFGNADELSQGCRYGVVVDAGRREFYVQSFQVPFFQVQSIVDVASLAVKPLCPPLLISHGGVQDFTEQFQLKTVYGSGAEEFVSLLADRDETTQFGGLAPFRAEDLFDIEDDFFVKDDDVRPLYLRAPDAKPQLGKTLIRRLS